MLIDLHAHAPHPGYYNPHPHWGPFFESRPDGDIKLRVGHWVLTLGSPERKAALLLRALTGKFLGRNLGQSTNGKAA